MIISGLHQGLKPHEVMPSRYAGAGRWLMVIIAAMMLGAGCSTASSLNTVLKADTGNYQLQRIAVLPFVNNTMEENAGEIATRAFVESLFNKHMEVEFDGNVRRLLFNERIAISKEMNADQIQLIGKRLNVDALIIGWVDKYDTGKRKRNASPVVALTARMVYVRDCSILWIGHHSRTGTDYETVLGYGRISSPVVLLRKVVHELIDTMA